MFKLQDVREITEYKSIFKHGNKGRTNYLENKNKVSDHMKRDIRRSVWRQIQAKFFRREKKWKWLCKMMIKLTRISDHE
jgi:hypothetical protein